MWLLPNSDCDALPGAVQQLRSLCALQSERNVGQTGAIITPLRLSLSDQATTFNINVGGMNAVLGRGAVSGRHWGGCRTSHAALFCSRNCSNTGVSHVSRLDHILCGGGPAPFPLPLRSKALGLHHKAAGESSTSVGGLCAGAGLRDARASQCGCSDLAEVVQCKTCKMSEI